MTNGWRLPAIVMALCVGSSLEGDGADTLPWNEEKPFVAATAAVTVRLATDRARARIGGDLEIDLEFRVERGSTWLYNPFVDRDLRLPGRLLLLNRAGQPVCNVFDSWFGERRSASERDFLYLYYGQRIGGKQTVKIPEYATPTGGAKLVPGKYYLQYFGDGLTFSGPFDPKRQPVDDWLAMYPGRSLLRSQAVPLELTAE
jgi:hypothetical protein